MKKLINTFLLLSFCYLAAAQQKLQQIEVVKSDNPVLSKRIYQLMAANTLSLDDLTQLKEYVTKEAGFKTSNENDPAIFFEVMNWVSNQWQHNGWKSGDSLTSLQILVNARNGEKYRCVEYARVLNDVLLSFGYISRTVALKNSNSAYGGAEMGHVAVEAWSNKLAKWIFLDPQFNVYLTFNGIVTNIYDIYKAKRNGGLASLKVLSGNTAETASKSDYLNFLVNYLGYISIKMKDGTLLYELALKMEGKNEYLTFQSLPWGKTIFTDDYRELYFSLNQTMIIIDYTKEETERAMNELKKCPIKSVDDFNKSMPLFSAKPYFTLSFDNNMVGFDQYEITLNNQTWKVKDQLNITLEPGLNYLTAICINKNGIKGIPTSYVLKYE
jgi:hypothetical protein